MYPMDVNANVTLITREKRKIQVTGGDGRKGDSLCSTYKQISAQVTNHLITEILYVR